MKLKAKFKKVASLIVVALFWAMLWQIAAMAVGNRLILPYPIDVIIRLWELAATAEFWRFAALSLCRVFFGILLSIPTALILSSITARFSLADILFSPAVTLMKSVPVVSFILIAIFIIDRQLIPSLITYVMIFPVLYENLREGIAQTSPDLLSMARLFDLPFYVKLRRIYYPAVKPFFFTALYTSIGLAIKAGIAAEVVAYIPESIGKMLSDAKSYMEPADLFAWTAVIILASFVSEKLARYLIGFSAGHKRRSKYDKDQ